MIILTSERAVRVILSRNGQRHAIPTQIYVHLHEIYVHLQVFRDRLCEVDDCDHLDEEARLARHLVADAEPDLLRDRQHVVRLCQTKII